MWHWRKDKKIRSVRIIILHDPVSWYYFNVLVTGQGQNYIFFSHRKFTIEQINQTLWSAITSRTHLRCDPWNNREIPSYKKNVTYLFDQWKRKIMLLVIHTSSAISESLILYHSTSIVFTHSKWRIFLSKERKSVLV